MDYRSIPTAPLGSVRISPCDSETTSECYCLVKLYVEKCGKVCVREDRVKKVQRESATIGYVLLSARNGIQSHS